MNRKLQLHNLIEQGAWLRDQLDACHNRLMESTPFSPDWDQLRTRRDWLRLRIASCKNKIEKLQATDKYKEERSIKPGETWETYNEQKPYNHE